MKEDVDCGETAVIPIVFFKVYFIDYAITIVPFFSSPLFPSILYPLPSASPHSLSSRPRDVHISSLASPFPGLFLTSPCLFCAIYASYSPILPHLLLSADNPICDLHFCDFYVVVVCLVYLFIYF